MSSLRLRLKNSLIVRRVVGHSMQPALRPGQVVVASSWPTAANGDVVVAVVAGRELVKRLHLSDSSVKLVGDNSADSIDYVLKDNNQLAKVIWPRV